eukprot:TRINITY_DN31859_c0_g1_i1.p1 TRINITY_DN31859_c0_g1~~TRINITY_DN31859_c0_g1_i1.p1  ORF type:complete len:291 (+),score=55.36 TRINITY_DN31859_c0_g1_i1:41-913(+)
MSIREIKAELDALGVSYADVTEKSELVARLAAARAKAPSTSASSSAPVRPPPKQQATSAPRAPSPSGSSEPVAVELRRIMACSATDYYALLGVPRGADENGLKKAYRKLALQLHPDKCKFRGADEAFKRISAAFSVLSDPGKRRKYDFMGAEACAGGGSSSGFSGASSFGTRFGDTDAEELFRAFFGPAAASGTRTTGGNARTTEVDSHAGNLPTRLMKAFQSNPWTLVTLLSGLVSLANIAESLSQLLGGASQLLMLLPLAAAAIYYCPAEYRRHGAMLAAGVLFSSFW